MRLNSNIEEYDVKSLSQITNSVNEILSKCKKLDNGANSLSHNISMAQMGFDNENMTRGKELINKYIQKLESAERELKELVDSVNDFSEKLKKAWRSW